MYILVSGFTMTVVREGNPLKHTYLSSTGSTVLMNNSLHSHKKVRFVTESP